MSYTLVSYVLAVERDEKSSLPSGSCMSKNLNLLGFLLPLVLLHFHFELVF